MRGKVILESSDDTSDDEVARGHADSTGDEDALTSELVYPKDSGNCEDKLHDTYNTGRKKIDRVACQSDTPEDKWPILSLVNLHKNTQYQMTYA